MTWWEAFYDEHLARALLEGTDPRDLEQTLSFFVRHLNLTPGARVYDQCCGIGRLSLPLARQGYQVIGVDQAPAYIEQATADADAEDLPITLLARDAFEFLPEAPVDAAINWWTSFGYAATDEQNTQMLCRAFESLRPGGRFALDFMNLPGVLHGFHRDAVDHRPVDGGDLVLHRESRLNLPEGVLEKTWRYFLPDGRRVSHETRVRLYMPHQLVEILTTVGFTDVQLFGAVDSSPLTLESPRCIAVATRPRRPPTA